MMPSADDQQEAEIREGNPLCLTLNMWHSMDLAPHS
jgi:hypothetical protein